MLEHSSSILYYIWLLKFRHKTSHPETLMYKGDKDIATYLLFLFASQNPSAESTRASFEIRAVNVCAYPAMPLISTTTAFHVLSIRASALTRPAIAFVLSNVE